MKYLIIILLFTSCSMSLNPQTVKKKKPFPTKEVSICLVAFFVGWGSVAYYKY